MDVTGLGTFKERPPIRDFQSWVATAMTGYADEWMSVVSFDDRIELWDDGVLVCVVTVLAANGLTAAV